MLKIDSHQHFWNYDAVRAQLDHMKIWMCIQRMIFCPNISEAHSRPKWQLVDVCWYRSDQSPEENEFQLQNATRIMTFIKGVL
jgi:L-fuconolactonase